MADSARQSVLKLLPVLCKASRIDPLEVAALLGRRLQLESEDEYQTTFQLVGAPPIPYERAHVVWLKQRQKGMMAAFLAPEARVPMEEVLDQLREYQQQTPLIPDGRMEGAPMCHAIRIPAGEARLHFPHRLNDFTLIHFGVSQIPSIAWKDPAGPPGPV